LKKGKIMLKRLIRIAGLGAAALTLFLWSGPGKAKTQSDVRQCPADRPCITELYQSGSTLIIGWDGHENFDHYNFRWSRPGRAETQSEVRGGGRGSFRINNINSDTRYIVKVQGCNRSPFGRSSCTPWYEDSFDTRSELHHGPDTCKNGFVWREARPGDHVCVTPQTRSQTAADNRMAASRRSPNGGPYGPDTCKQGYVWREAFPGDLVCVPPQTRAQAAEDNSLAASRRVR
jgi:hypothetical protein